MNDETISVEALTDAGVSTLVAAGAAPQVAAALAQTHVSCERDGALSHGIFRVPQYLQTLRTGYLDGRAEPQVEQVTSSFLRVDARDGVAQFALQQATPAALHAVAEQGVAVVAIRNSHHHSALWPDLEPFARQGYVAISSVTGGVPYVAPFGARRAALSTNPLAFAVPLPGDEPLVVDFATSSMSHGDLTLAAKAGRSVPAGTGVDAEGRETTDAEAIREGGMLLPFGGHKGAALSMFVELLASALTGGQFSFETRQGKPEGAHTSRTGQFLLLLDPERGNPHDFGGRTSQLIDMLRAAGVDRMPAEHRYRVRREALAHGIPMTPPIRDLLAALPQ